MAVPYDVILSNLSKVDKKLLLILDSNDKLSYTSLKKALKGNQRALDIAISGVETSGLVIRNKDLEDYRTTYFSLTEHGRNIIKML